MLVVMQTHATPDQIEHVVQAIRDMQLTPHPMPGATRTAIGITCNIGSGATLGLPYKALRAQWEVANCAAAAAGQWRQGMPGPGHR